MEVRASQMTVADLRDGLKARRIRVNKDYQRSSRVWSTAAQSYLIDTMLKGYPIPKIYLWQTTDLKTMKTESEIVDGQQRSHAILGFVENELRITTRGEFSGKRYSDLAEDDQQSFLEYAVGVDQLVGATPKQVREVYRRINSYTTPLNAQEKRFASAFVGEDSAKYMVLALAEKYSEVLVQAKTLDDAKIGRMVDQEFIASILNQLRLGVHTAAPRKLDKLYEEELPHSEVAALEARLVGFFDWLPSIRDLYGSEITGKEQLLTLAIAYTHVREPLATLAGRNVPTGNMRSAAGVLDALGELNEIIVPDLESIPPSHPLRRFAVASAAGTNTEKNRLERVRTYAAALCAQS